MIISSDVKQAAKMAENGDSITVYADDKPFYFSDKTWLILTFGRPVKIPPPTTSHPSSSHSFLAEQTLVAHCMLDGG